MSGRRLYPLPKRSVEFKPPKATPTPTIDQFNYRWASPPPEARLRSEAAEKAFFCTEPLDWPSSSEDSEDEVPAITEKAKSRQAKLKKKTSCAFKLAKKAVRRTCSMNLSTLKDEPAEKGDEQVPSDDEFDFVTGIPTPKLSEKNAKVETFFESCHALQKELGKKFDFSSHLRKLMKKREGKDEGKIESEYGSEESLKKFSHSELLE